jgi:hypothetical protein
MNNLKFASAEAMASQDGFQLAPPQNMKATHESSLRTIVELQGLKPRTLSMDFMSQLATPNHVHLARHAGLNTMIIFANRRAHPRHAVHRRRQLRDVAVQVEVERNFWKRLFIL